MNGLFLIGVRAWANVNQYYGHDFQANQNNTKDDITKTVCRAD